MSVIAAAAVPHPPIILPEVGRGEEKKIQKTIDAYRDVMRRLTDLRPETIVLPRPQTVMSADYFHISPGGSAQGDLHQFGVRDLTVDAVYDTRFAEALAENAESRGVPAGALGERDRSLDHGVLIPLRFLQEVYDNFRLVRIGLSWLPPLMHYRMGQSIAETAEKLGRRTAIIASGDLSHKLKKDGPYGFTPEGPIFDKALTQAFAAGDFDALLRFPQALSEAAAECGLRSFQIMAGALDGKAVKSELLSYEGPFGVGYGVAVFEVTGNDPSRRFAEPLAEEEQRRLQEKEAGGDAYVRLARLSLETYITTGRRAGLPDHLPSELLTRRAGVFVSLKKDGQLRGCIGTIGPVTGSVAEEILRNAVSAAVEDPRFPPVRADELPDLDYSVDVLGETEDIASPAELDVKRYGVIVSSGHRRGLLLPNLEGVDSVEQQISIARQKAGIGARESVQLQRFEVVRHR